LTIGLVAKCLSGGSSCVATLSMKRSTVVRLPRISESLVRHVGDV
jgi:hypothetical protein